MSNLDFLKSALRVGRLRVSVFVVFSSFAAASPAGGEGHVDLSVQCSSDADRPLSGDEFTFSVALTNNGPADATGLVIDNQLPAGIRLLNNVATRGSYDPGTGTWGISNLSNGASAELDLLVRVEPQAIGTTLINAASVEASDQTDEMPENDSCTTEVQIQNLSNGLYALFETNMGSFTARLDYVEAPLTVGNFVSLAEGTRAWLNVDTGRVQKSKYFDGLVFHRVVSGFVIQGGSHNGLGSGGPGYRFPDEFDPSLRHNKAMILSMANSGLFTNGSQFFITLSKTEHLDDKHSIFGEVISGSSVVSSIGQVPVDAEARPVTDVAIEEVRIIRVGAAARGFNPDYLDLPDASGIPVMLDPETKELVHTNSQYARHSIAYTTNLLDESTWEPIEDYHHEAPDELHIVDLSALTNGHPSAQSAYFSAAKVQYTETAFLVPQSLVAKELLLNIDVGFPGQWVKIGFFSIATGGIQTSFPERPTATLNSYEFKRDEPYTMDMGNFTATPSLYIANLRLAFSEKTGGPFSGVLVGREIRGTFTISDL